MPRPAAPDAAARHGAGPRSRRAAAASITIPICKTPPEAAARAALVATGLRLVRQERWEDLLDTLQAADSSHARTPGGTPAARLLCEGALQDTLARAAEAVRRGDAALTRAAVTDFTATLGPTTEAPMRGLLAASAHIAVAGLWRGAASPARRREAAALDHLETAHLLLRPHDPEALGSTALAAARCAVIEVLPEPGARLTRAHEAVLHAEPHCPDHLRAYGHDLSPGRFGTWPALDRAARRMAMRTEALWRHGAYAWLWLDALSSQPEGFTHVDAELFVAALHDILQAPPALHHPAVPPEEAPPVQHFANLLAAWCAALPAGAQIRNPARARIAGALEWIVADHLHELHPALWAPAPGAPDQRRDAAPAGAAPADPGTCAALRTLGALYDHQLARGRSVIFTDLGIALQPTGCASCTLAPCAALAYPPLNLRDEDPPCLT